MNSIKTILQKLTATGFFHIFGSGTLVQVVTFLSNIILINIVAKDVYGLFTYAANIYSMIMLLSGLGASSTVLQLASENFQNPKKRAAIYQFGLIFGILANFILASSVIVAGALYPFQIEGAQLLVYLYTILPILQYLTEYQAIYLRSERNNKGYSFVNLLNAILIMIFSIAGALTFGAAGFILAQYCAALLIAIIGIYRFKVPLLSSREKLSRTEIFEFVKYSLIVSVGNAFSQLKTIASAFVLGLMIPNAELLAAYNVALKIPVALLFVPYAICIYLYPYFAEHINDPLWCLKNFKKATLIIFIVNALITIVGILASEPLITFLFGSQYLDALDAFRILLFNFLLAGTFNTLPGNLLGAQRKFAYNLGVNILTGTLNVLLCVAFISLFGVNGAAWAIVTTTAISGCFYVGGLLHTYKKKLKSSKN